MFESQYYLSSWSFPGITSARHGLGPWVRTSDLAIVEVHLIDVILIAALTEGRALIGCTTVVPSCAKACL